MLITICFKDILGAESADRHFEKMELDCSGSTVYCAGSAVMTIEVHSIALAMYIVQVFSGQLHNLVGGVESITIKSVV